MDGPGLSLARQAGPGCAQLNTGWAKPGLIFVEWKWAGPVVKLRIGRN